MIVSITVHKKEYSQYLQNMHEHYFINTRPNLHSNETHKEEDVIYNQFPATSIEQFN